MTQDTKGPQSLHNAEEQEQSSQKAPLKEEQNTNIPAPQNQHAVHSETAQEQTAFLAPHTSPESPQTTPIENSEKANFSGNYGTAPIHLATPTYSIHSPTEAQEQNTLEAPMAETFASPNSSSQTDTLHMAQEIHTGSTAQPSEHTQTAPENSEEKAPEETLPLGPAAKGFQHMAKWGPLYLCLFFILHMFASLWFPSIFYHMELQYIEVFTKMQQSGQWLIPPATDALGATFPGYFWFMSLVQLIPVPESLFLPILSSLTAFIALSGVYTLGRCCRLENNGAFGALLLLLSCPLFLVFLHLVGPELLTTGFFCFALALIFRGLTQESAPFSFIFGFTFTALATFTGGFLPLWTVLIASILLVLWRLDIHRAHKLDAVVGFGCMVLLFATWLVVVILGSQHADVLHNLMQQALVPFIPPYWPVPTPWALAFLCMGLIPWMAAPLFSPWFAVLKNSFKSLKASRTDNSGPTWLYLVLFVGMALVVLQKSDILSAALPLLPVLGIILGATVCNFSKTGSNVFFLLFAVFLLLCGALLTIISIPSAAPYWSDYVSKFTSKEVTTILQTLPGLPILSGLFILTAALLIKFTQRQSAQGSLLVMALFSVLAVQPFFILISPSLVGTYAKYHSLGGGLGTVLLPESMPQPKLENTVVQPLWKNNSEKKTPEAPAVQTPAELTNPKAQTSPSTVVDPKASEDAKLTPAPAIPEIPETPAAVIPPPVLPVTPAPAAQ